MKGFPRPLLNLTVESFATVMNSAFGRPLLPPFDPYASDINYLLASYVIPYVGLTGYVGANAKLQSPRAKRVQIHNTLWLNPYIYTHIMFFIYIHIFNSHAYMLNT